MKMESKREQMGKEREKYSEKKTEKKVGITVQRD